MNELILLLEKLGITLLEDAAPELIADAKEQGLAFLSQAKSSLEDKIKTLKVAQHLAKFGHGLLIDDAKLAVEEGVLAGVNAAIKIISEN